MSTTLFEQADAILENSDYNDLPYEERKRIGRYKHETQILTIMQMIEKNKDLTCQAWRDKQRARLASSVRLYRQEWGE